MSTRPLALRRQRAARRPPGTARSLWWPAAGAVLLAAALSGCGGGGASVPDTSVRNASALAASRPGELQAYVKDKLRARQAEREANPGGVIDYTVDLAPPWLAVATTASGTVTRSGTTVQEAGVDEDDLIKSEGNLIVTLAPSVQSDKGMPYAQMRLHLRGSDGQLQAASQLDLLPEPDTYALTHGMLLAADVGRAVVIGEVNDATVGIPYCPPSNDIFCILPYRPTILQSRVQLQMVDVSDASRAALADRVTIDGRLIGTRQIGRMLYVVSTHGPQFAYEALPATATAAEREAELARLNVTDMLPKIRIGRADPVPLVTETDCYVQPANASLDLQVTTITAFDLGSPTLSRSSRCFIGGTEALYMSPASIYLATSRYEVQTLQTLIAYQPDARTDIHKFAVSGAAIDYRGSGEVRGHLGWDNEKKSYRMSEHGGDLRVLTFTGETGWVTPTDALGTKPASPATLSILRERSSDRSLQLVSTLPNTQRPASLGKPGEQIYGVRFYGDRAYLVTFRQVDPLYVLDLSNPADPRAVGELTMPGFSDYLFPLDGGLLLGVGKDASDEGRLQGVKVALFDVADAAHPRQLAAQSFGERGSVSGLDYSRHGITMLTRGHVVRISMPLGLYQPLSGLMQQGLQRLEVDLTARTLSSKPLITVLPPGWSDMSTDRSLQIDDQVYYLTQGRLSVWDW